ncbi:MAG: hypothetical protein JWL79_1953 [Frankiales bacterium]|nr:hypothetical protein [Frankiales bacterium]
MTLPLAARRSLALAATTALLTSGATGLLGGAAFAVGPNTGTVTSISPTVTNNTGDTAVTLNGSLFVPQSDSPLLAPTFQSAYGSSGTPGLVGTTDQANSSSTKLVGSVPTTNAPPGVYDVYTSRTDPTGTSVSAKCGCPFTISSSGAPDASGVLFGAPTSSTTSRGALPLDVSGQNLAEASYVDFFLPDGVTKDPGLAFTVGDPNDTSHFPGYASAQLIRGNYTHSGAFTPGKHLLRVTNTVGETGSAAEFWQPTFAAAGVSPTSTGAGSQSVVVTVSGQGIRQGSRLSIQGFKSASQSTPTTTVQDVSAGTATVSADGTQISAPFSFTQDASGSPRAITISGPDGGNYSVANVFTVTPGPSIGSLDTSALGQGANYVETISGSGFASGTNASTLPAFTVSGPGVTTQTLSATNISAKVRFLVAPDAPTGDRSVTVTNPDGGTSTAAPTSTSSPFTVDAGPTISSVSPASAPAGSTKTITLKGANFDGPPNGKITVQFSLPPAAGAARTADPSLSVGTVTVTNANPATGAPAQATFSLGIANNAPAGLRDIVVTNPSDFGSVVCAGCFGVDNLTAAPSTGSNNGTKSVALTGAGVVSGSTAKLVRAGTPGIQPDIAGASPGVSGSTLTAIFDLTDAAPGTYNAVVTTPGGAILSCSSCFTVTGSSPTVSSVTPAAGGQGASNLPITIAGNNFSRGEQITITGVSVHDVVWVSRTQITAKVDIPAATATGAKDVKATNADGVNSGTLTGGFTVDAPPSPTAVSPTSYGQGAQGVKITVTGPGFVTGSSPATSSTVSFGPGVTVTAVTVTQGTVIPVVAPTPDDTLVATVNIDQTAGAVQRDVVVTNPDGGVGTLAKGFSVNFGPKVTGVVPGFLAPDASGKAITINGSNFSTTSGKTAIPTIDGVTLSNVVVASDGNSISATASVDSGTAKGAKDVEVKNPTDSGVGSCVGCLLVATPPGPPTSVHTVGVTGTSVTAGWTAPTDDGGAPITGYVVSAKDSGGNPAGTPATVGPNATAGTVTGLAGGVKYSIFVLARNVAGDSTAGSTLAQTSGVPPKGDTILTSGHHPSLSTTGQPMTLSGRLLKASTGAGISGATVELALSPDVGSASFPKVLTNSTGGWSYTFHPIYSYTIRTLFRGNSTSGPSQATSYRLGVSTRVTVTSPSNGARSSVKSPLVVRGGTSPNKSGNLITLYRYSGGRYVAVQNVRVASNGTYRFSVNLARGSYTLKVGIGRTHGNFVGYSPAFGVHRI